MFYGVNVLFMYSVCCLRGVINDNNNNNNNNRLIITPNASAKLLLSHLDRRLSEKSGESRETFLFQRCSVLLQRFNAVLLHDSMPACYRMEF